MSRIRIWLQGKKTYFSAGALAVVACFGYFGGILDGANTVALLTFAGGLAGLGAKSQRTADAILLALDNVRDAQARAGLDHKRTDLKRFAKEVARELSPAVVAGVTAQPIAQPPAAAGASNRKKRNIASREPGAKRHEAMEGKR